MKLRFSFSLKILLPYLLIAFIFTLVLSRGIFKGDGVLSLLSLSGLFISILAGVLHFLWLKRPLNRASTLTDQLSSGILPVFKAVKSKGELGALERNLAKLVENLRSLTLFTRSMASGDFSGNYEKLGSEDEIGEALLALKGSLIASRKESKARRRDDENRSWAAHGLAKFSKLFREAEDDLHKLSRELMRELVAYTEADVGALFITMGADLERPVLQMAGSYAFEGEQFSDQSFEFGEGLVGRAALEKDLLYILNFLPTL
jgi:HAMP domain-containing protein